MSDVRQDQRDIAPATRRHFIVATAGHIDHGKSVLVQALTGTNPDRLPEEKARGITIDLGFARLELAADGLPGTALEIGIIDVPGHEDFVKNMLAGAGSIDLALLVVAADDGWMPQTEEHLQILAYLGVTRAIVVLTKIDLAGVDPEAKRALVREKLIDTPFAQAPIVPVSALNGQGVSELKRTLARVLADTPALPDIGKPRLPIDRAFRLQGIGTVVTGTLRGGCLHKGQEVLVLPAGNGTHIRNLQCFNRDVASAVPGSRVALNLANATLSREPGHAHDPLALRRGCVVALSGLGSPHGTCDLLLERSSRALMRDDTGPGLRKGARVRFHTGSASVTGHIHFFDRQELGLGERCLAQIRLDAPVYAFAGDHFVLRDCMGQKTLGGGMLLNPCATRKGKRWAGWQSALSTAAPKALDPLVAIAAQLEERRVLKKTTLLAQSNFSSAEIAAAVSELEAAGQCSLAGEFVLHVNDWKELNERARTLIEACHKSHPEQAGLSIAELRSALGQQLRSAGVFEALIAELLRSGFSQAGSNIRRTTHHMALPPQLQAAKVRIQATLNLRPLDPPSRKELSADRASQEALVFLLRTGEAIELGPDIILSRTAFARAADAIRQFLRQRGSATVSELRQVLGASRRVVVPLLEKLDREGLTQRHGDKRLLKA